MCRSPCPMHVIDDVCRYHASAAEVASDIRIHYAHAPVSCLQWSLYTPCALLCGHACSLVIWTSRVPCKPTPSDSKPFPSRPLPLFIWAHPVCVLGCVLERGPAHSPKGRQGGFPLFVLETNPSLSLRAAGEMRSLGALAGCKIPTRTCRCPCCAQGTYRGVVDGDMGDGALFQGRILPIWQGTGI